MARISKKKSLKRVAPAAVPKPTYDTLMKADDLLLVNRGNADLNTDAGDLAQFVGKELELDTLVESINTEIGDQITNINSDLTDLEVKVDANKDSIDQINTDLGDLTDRVEQNEKDIVVNADGIAANAGDIATNAGDIADNKTAIDTNKGLIDDNKASIDALEADQDRQNSWTGIAGGTNSDTSLTHDARITTNAEAIARLQGALVYRGSADISAAPPADNSGEAWVAGDFVSANGATSSPNAGWNAIGTVAAGDYFAYNGSTWGPAGSNATVIPDINDGSLTIKAGTDAGITVTGGTGFSANTAGDVETTVSIKVDPNGGLETDGNGIGINIDTGNNGNGGDTSIIIGSDGISVNPDFISGIAGPTPNLQAVTDEGATTTNEVTVAKLVSSGAVTAVGSNASGDTSSFLFKGIHTLPKLT